MQSKKTIALGLLAAVVGAALFVGAAAVLTGGTDPQGFTMSEAGAFSAETRAIVAADAASLAEVPAGFTGSVADPSTVRIRSTSASPGGLFIGIASSAHVERFLGKTAYDAADVAFDKTAVAVEYEAHPGTAVPRAPSHWDIWVAWTEADRPQTLEWDIQAGDWTAVVMNSDGSAGVDADLAFGAAYDSATALAFPAVLIAAVLMVGGAYGIYRGTRKPEDEERSKEDREPLVDEKVPAFVG